MLVDIHELLVGELLVRHLQEGEQILSPDRPPVPLVHRFAEIDHIPIIPQDLRKETIQNYFGAPVVGHILLLHLLVGRIDQPHILPDLAILNHVIRVVQISSLNDFVVVHVEA